MKAGIVAVALVLFFLFPYSTHAAVTLESISVDLDGSEVSVTGAMIPLDDLELHIGPGVITTDAGVELRKTKALNKRKKLPNLPGHYRSKRNIYEYDLGIQPAGDVIVRIHYNGKKQKRHRVFFLADGATQWKRLRTVVHGSEQYAQVVLPAQQGKLLVATHRWKGEQPIKATNHSRYGNLPYSDTAAIMDVASGRFLHRDHAKKQRSIASITKIATSLVFLESGESFDGTVTYSGAYDRIGATADIAAGDELRKQDVLMATLIRSANNMAVTLANSTALSEDAFVATMNSRMSDLGLKRTHFEEPTGLDSDNVSTAGNLARLAAYAFEQYPEIYEAAADASSYSFTVANTGRSVSLPSTNKFDGRGKYELVAFKTGYLPGTADRTLVAQIRRIGDSGEDEPEIVVVLLGNPQYNTIFDEAYALADWAFSNWVYHNY